VEIFEILTKRLALKKSSPADGKALCLEPNNWQVAKWLARGPNPYTLSETEPWVDVINHMGSKIIASRLQSNEVSLKILQAFSFEIQGYGEYSCHPQGEM